MDDGPGNTVPCPNCKKHEAGKLRFTSSLSSYVDYYRCDACGYVWVKERERTHVPTLSADNE